jgi:hypothetical protein
MGFFRLQRYRFQSRFYLRILQIMGLCGAGFLASCLKYGDPEPEYGAPFDELKFHGTVKSGDSLIHIPGLSIRLLSKSYPADSLSTTTDAQGKYRLYGYAEKGEQFTLKILDTDGDSNVGHFQNKILELEISGRDISNLEKQADALLDKK